MKKIDPHHDENAQTIPTEPLEKDDPIELDAIATLDEMQKNYMHHEAVLAEKRAQAAAHKEYILGLFPKNDPHENYLRELQIKPLQIAAKIMETTADRRLEFYSQVCAGRLEKLKVKQMMDLAIARSNGVRKVTEVEMNNEVRLRAAKSENALELAKIHSTSGKQLMKTNQDLLAAAEECRRGILVNAAVEHDGLKKIASKFNNAFVRDIIAEALLVEAATAKLMIRDTSEYVSVLRTAQSGVILEAAKSLHDNLFEETNLPFEKDSEEE